mmetsp:Transcript_4397/g.15267  ORF Transcript_4397/g.15267 Transcript_4397/m.15267 type:complete len:371 (-) Transcript_4397:2410-3522(-)
MSKEGGLSGASLLRLRLTLQSETPMPQEHTYVVKRRDGDGHSVALGLAREALFYAELAPALAEARLLPRILHSHGVMQTGEKLIVMEDLSQDGVQSGLYFGSHSPLNWGKDLEKLTTCAGLSPAPTPEGIISLAFACAAKLHATFWRAPHLTELPWLRGSKWLAGEGEEAFHGAMAQSTGSWERLKGAGLTEAGVKWDPLMVRALNASHAKAKDFGAFQAELKARAWTLVHGDFHPANMQIRAGEEGSSPSPAAVATTLFDFEQVGLGSPAQELGQYLISHPTPALRERVERQAVAKYHEALKRNNAEADLSWEECWAEYVAGGIGRWMWMLPILAAMSPPPVAQYFHDQVLAFIKTHLPDPEQAPMPRV